MKFKVEYAVIAVLVLALIYYIYSYGSLVNDFNNLRNDIMSVPHENNPQLKTVKNKHSLQSFIEEASGFNDRGKGRNYYVGPDNRAPRYR